MLSQLKHHNSSVRHDALTGLRELLLTHSELVHPNFPKLIQPVFSTAVDILPNVRQASCALIKVLMSQLSSVVIQPFFPVIIAQLSCGMTHINEKIQLDSVKLLALYLQHHPELLVVHVGKILPLLMNLLSRCKSVQLVSKSESKEKTRKHEAFRFQVVALDNNPSSKLMSLDSRLNILSMISQLLEITLGSLNCDAWRMISTSNIVDISRGKVFSVAELTLEDNIITSSICNLSAQIPHVPIVLNHGIIIPDHCAQGLTASSLTIIDIFSDYEAFLCLMNTLGILVLESWVECVPSQVFSSNIPSVPHVTVMSKLIDVLSLLVKLLLAVQACSSSMSLQKSCDQLSDLHRMIVNGVSTYMIRYFPFSIAAESHREQFFQLQHTANFAFSSLLLSLRKVSCAMAMEGNENGQLTCATVEYLTNFDIQTMKHLTSSSQFLLTCTKLIVQMIPNLCELSSESTEEMASIVGAFKFIREYYAFCHPQSASRHLLIKCLYSVFAQQAAKKDNLRR